MPEVDRAHRTYGVKLVRGPFVELAPHRGAVADRAALAENLESFKRPRAADLFCGAGGLSLGLQSAGFDVIVGIDSDSRALETYASLFPGLALNRDLSTSEAVGEVVELLNDCDVSLIAGGPPCQPFSRAGSSKIRSLVEAGERDAYDRRRDLWEAWLEIVREVHPKAVLLENVPEMAIGGNMRIVRTIVESLEADGYGVHTRILKAFEHGVPQFRQRFFLVALASEGGFGWPTRDTEQPGVGDAISDLPPVEGGWRPAGGADGYLEYMPPREPTSFVRRARVGMTGRFKNRVYDHITRPVRDDDRCIFEMMDSETRYSDLEDGPHKRYRDDIFNDKYKRLGLGEPSRSITAHIAKDGYWYIHPTQVRTLTVREAARIQTFPDRVRFAGPPSAAFRQIGNAVPPLLAERVGRQIMKTWRRPMAATSSTTEVSRALALWLGERAVLHLPWLGATTQWQVIAAEILLGRSAPNIAREGWSILQTQESPAATLEFTQDLELFATKTWRGSRAAQVFRAATWYVHAEDPFDTVETMALNPEVSGRIADLAEVVVGDRSVAPILWTAPILRVAARWSGQPVDRVDKGSAGRLTVARMVGGSASTHEARRVSSQAALLELAYAVCKPNDPQCEVCPLRKGCVTGRIAESRSRRSPTGA